MWTEELDDCVALYMTSGHKARDTLVTAVMSGKLSGRFFRRLRASTNDKFVPEDFICAGRIALDQRLEHAHRRFSHLATWKAYGREWRIQDAREREVVESGDSNVVWNAQFVLLKPGNEAIGRFIV